MYKNKSCWFVPEYGVISSKATFTSNIAIKAAFQNLYMDIRFKKTVK